MPSGASLRGVTERTSRGPAARLRVRRSALRRAEGVDEVRERRDGEAAEREWLEGRLGDADCLVLFCSMGVLCHLGAAFKVDRPQTLQ